MTDAPFALIVGAGPTGLVLACQLLARGVSVRLIDALAEPVTTSRAFTIHARTLELLAQLELGERLLARGHETYSMDYHFPGMGETPCLDFRALDSRHRYCLTINQAETEAILRERVAELGGTIEWGTRLLGFEQAVAQQPEQVIARVADVSGGEVEITAAYLIGCDGFASTVRQQLALPFDGSEYAGTMRMMDVPLTGYPLADDAIHYHIAKDHMLLVAKLPGEHHRVLVSDRSESPASEHPRAAFQALFDRHFDGEVVVGEPVWATNFRISKRLTNAFREGRVFLAGDAAHVNSPAGGQGMNVAMQDACNLGWKLAAVARGEAPPALLDSYARERQPVAKQMLDGTSYIHSIIMAHGQGMTERIERMRGGEWNAQAVNQVAGIAYTYRAPDAEGRLCVGDRAPDGALGDGRVYDLVAPGRPTVLVFEREHADEAERIASARAAVHVIDDDAIADRYRVDDSVATCVIRPDLHVGYLGELAGLDAALAEYCMP